MRSKTYMSKINLQRGKLTVENRKSREKKTDMLRSIGKQSGVPSASLKNAIVARHCQGKLKQPANWSHPLPVSLVGTINTHLPRVNVRLYWAHLYATHALRRFISTSNYRPTCTGVRRHSHR